MNMDDRMIVFENVTKKYGEKTAISDLSFTVKKGNFSVIWGQTEQEKRHQ